MDCAWKDGKPADGKPVYAGGISLNGVLAEDLHYYMPPRQTACKFRNIVGEYHQHKAQEENICLEKEEHAGSACCSSLLAPGVLYTDLLQTYF